MPDVGKQFFLGELTTVADTILFTVGAAETAHILHLRLCSNSATTAQFTLTEGVDGSGTRIYKNFPISSAGTTASIEDLRSLIVLSTGVTFRGSANSTGITCGIWGVSVT